MKLFITGAGGKTGKSIIQSLIKKEIDITVYLHRQTSFDEFKKLGDVKPIVGDLLDNERLQQALKGIDTVYLIIPNMNPEEITIGKNIIDICKRKGVSRIIYHSVLHPQATSMPHHRQKMLVEEYLLESGLDYTILQPTAYMQNILGYRKAINSGSYPMPYPVTSMISLVDLIDIAEVASNVITQPGHSYSTYELVGTHPLSQLAIAEVLSLHTNRKVIAEEILLQKWLKSDTVKNMTEYTRKTLYAMFKYYAAYGLVGNNFVLSQLLSRKATSLEEFLKRDYII